MTRLSIHSASAVALVTTLMASAAFAETQAEIAARENEEGKTLMFSGKYAEASAKFQDAVARVPEPKYFFNLCTSRFQEGKFGDALTACNAADKNADDAKLKQKIALMQGKIKEEADKQGIDLQPAGGGASPGETPPVGDPNQPPVVDPNNPNQPPGPGPGPVGQPPAGYGVGAPPAVGLFQAQPVENKYVWTLGIDLFGGAGKIGQSGRFGEAASGFRLKSDYMLNPASRIGGQGYLQYTHFSEGEDMAGSGAYTLDVIDLGVAAYKHLCGRFSRGCLTPLAGVHFAMMSPQGQTDAYGEQLFNYGGFGARLELGYQYALGSRFEHVLGVTASANVYTKAFAEPSDGSATAMEQGLDKGGASFIVAFGYTYRFRTPFGSSPFVTLE